MSAAPVKSPPSGLALVVAIGDPANTQQPNFAKLDERVVEGELVSIIQDAAYRESI